MKNCQETKKKKVDKNKRAAADGRSFMLRKSGNQYQPGICG